MPSRHKKDIQTLYFHQPKRSQAAPQVFDLTISPAIVHILSLPANIRRSIFPSISFTDQYS
jgi:hypothetical protein